jgi:hypothetical protein
LEVAYRRGDRQDKRVLLMLLANTYTLEELKCLDFGQVALPVGWFLDWLNQLDAV